MTGRDMIIYILENHLEDEEIFKDGKPIGFMTDAEAAVKLQTGVHTIQIMYEMGKLNGIKIGNKIYISDIKEKNEVKNEKSIK